MSEKEKRWSDYQDTINAAVLDGKAFNLTIKGIDDEEFFDQETKSKESKPVLYFIGTDKGLIVSPINRKKLQEMYGDVIANCIGKRVKLKCVEVKAFGKIQNVVRIFEPDPVEPVKKVEVKEPTQENLAEALA